MSDLIAISLRWRHNGRDGLSNHQPHDCLLNCLFRRSSKKTPNLRVTGLCAGNSPGTGEFPAQMASNAENVSISWRHHVMRNAQDSILDMSLKIISIALQPHFPGGTELKVTGTKPQHSATKGKYIVCTIVMFHNDFPLAMSSPNNVYISAHEL